MEAIPSLRKDIRSATRPGLAILVRPVMDNSIQFVRDDREEVTKGVVQALMVEAGRGTRITGMYISPTVSGEMTEVIIRDAIRVSEGRDIILGELNGRHYPRDTKTNTSGEQF